MAIVKRAVREVEQVVRKVEGLEALDGPARPLAAAAGRATRARPVKNALSGTWLGHPLHPMLTDVPIGSWVAAGLLDLAGGAQADRAARYLVGFGVLAAVPTAAAGLSDWSDTYGAEQRVGLVHAAGNLAALSLQAASYLARQRAGRAPGPRSAPPGWGSWPAPPIWAATCRSPAGWVSTTPPSRKTSLTGPGSRCFLSWPRTRWCG